MSRTATPPPRQARDMAQTLEKLAWLMDRAFTIPGTKIRVGLDSVLGLLPVGGDIATGLVQAGIVLVALRHYKVPKAVAARMMANVLIDTGLGAIPFLGDLFDVAFKANTRNLKLLEQYREPVIDITPGARSSSPVSSATPIEAITSAIPGAVIGMTWRFLLPFAIVMLVMLGLLLVGFVTVVRWAIGA